ncbi:MAG: hypothetical protein IKO47_01735 [Ruminococcus sp.]|nr:hypothetical protein [Ruminococcus sp.]
MKITAALAAAAVLAAYPCVFPADTAAVKDGKVRIMPVGDSITDGYWEQGGYRKYMSCALTEKGYNDVDIVGPKGSDTETFDYRGKQVTYDGNYAGYSGYAIQEITGRMGILETLRSGDYIKEYSPDIVLLQIGTNDIISNCNEGITDRLENLITYILDEGCGTVYVTTIPDMDTASVSDWFWAYGDLLWNGTPAELAAAVQGYVDSYNNSIKELVPKMQAKGRDVRFADIHSVVDMTSDLYDGVHPNEQGYEKMGLYWADVLSGYLSGQQLPTGTTEDTTGGREKHYDVADLVSLCDYLLGRPQERITSGTYQDFDLNSSSTLDVYDVILLRRRLISGANVIIE